MSFILWFTGLSGAGKSTLATSLVPRLRERGVGPLEVLDGDEVRTHISKGLGFSREGRRTNILRIGYVARLLSRNGVVAISAAIAPYALDRDAVRQASEAPFVEVYVRVPLDTVIERDTKGLYRQALAGEIDNFTGISDPYEAPTQAEIVVDTDKQSVAQSVEQILDYLTQRGLIAAHSQKEVA